MQTRTIDLSNTLELPDKIVKAIEQRGFYLYEWITIDEIKKLIIRDVFKTSGFFLLIFVFFSGFFFGDVKNLEQLIFVLMAPFFITTLSAFVTAFILSIDRLIKFSKNHYVLVTNEFIFVNGSIFSLNEKRIIKNNIRNVEHTFQEPLFGDSSLYPTVVKNLVNFNSSISSSMKKLNLPFLIVVMISGLLFFTGGFLWIISSLFVGMIFFFLGFITFLGMIFNKLILKYFLFHKVTFHQVFLEINDDINKIRVRQEKLSYLLETLKNNNWDGGTIKKIHYQLSSMNQSISEIQGKIESIDNLKLKTVQGKDVQFNGMKIWLKNQVLEPMIEFYHIISKNYYDTLGALESNKELKNTENTSIEKSTVYMQVLRLENKLEEMKKTMNILKTYIKKLQ